MDQPRANIGLHHSSQQLVQTNCFKRKDGGLWYRYCGLNCGRYYEDCINDCKDELGCIRDDDCTKGCDITCHCCYSDCDEDPKEYEVDDIVAEGYLQIGRRRRPVYMVKWKGYQDTSPTDVLNLADTAALDRWEQLTRPLRLPNGCLPDNSEFRCEEDCRPSYCPRERYE
jgi:hypothetical protein